MSGAPLFPPGSWATQGQRHVLLLAPRCTAGPEHIDLSGKQCVFAEWAHGTAEGHLWCIQLFLLRGFEIYRNQGFLLHLHPKEVLG